MAMQRYPATACFGLRLGGYYGWGSGWMEDYPGVPLPKPGDFAAFGCIPPLPVGPPYDSLVGCKIRGAVWPQSPGTDTTFEVFFADSKVSNDDYWSEPEFPGWNIDEPYTLLGTFSFTSTTVSEIVLEPIPLKFGSPHLHSINGTNNAGSAHWWANSWYPWVRVLTGGVYIQYLEILESPVALSQPRGAATGQFRNRAVAWETT